MAHKADAEKDMTLPLLAVGPSDVARLLRELQALDEYLHQAGLKRDHEVKLPRTSRMLDELAGVNELNLLQATARKRAAAFLQDTREHAPVITISFAADPSSAFTGKVVGWLRQNVHPLLLLRIGLQPNIAAGCTVRTANRYYDFSLRSHFKQQRTLLLEKLREASGPETQS